MTADVIFACLVAWSVLGPVIFNLYARSSVELHFRMELLLAVLCGPVVWYVLYRGERRRAAQERQEEAMGRSFKEDEE